jgi:tetratricopeptide (TPR) repeat protein
MMWLQVGSEHARAAELWMEYQLSVDGAYGREKNGEAPRSGDVLERAAKERPDALRYQLELGDLYRKRFLQSEAFQAAGIPLLQVRSTVENSRFADVQQRDKWLDGVYGVENRKKLEAARSHYWQALRLCPLDGSAYVRLAELQFLAGPNEPSIAGLLEQGMKARPNDGAVCYEAGKDYLNREELVAGMKCWRQCSQISEKHKQVVLLRLVEVAPLPKVIEHFQPDYPSLLELARGRFAGKEDRNARLYLLKQATVQLREERDKEILAKRMCELYEAFVKDGDHDQAKECIQKAIAVKPNDVGNRVRLARLHLGQQNYKEAQGELDWCARQQPANAEVKDLRRRLFDEMNRRPEPGPGALQGKAVKN